MRAFWFLPLLALAGPALGAQQSALPPGLDCIGDRLSAGERRALADVAIEQGSRDDPRAQPLLRATEACGNQLSWSLEKRRLAGTFTLSAAGVTAVRALLGRRGISFDELDRAILGDRELMAGAEAGQLGNSTIGRDFAMRHIAVIERMAAGRELTQELGTRIGNYIAFRAIAEASRRQFAREP